MFVFHIHRFTAAYRGESPSKSAGISRTTISRVKPPDDVCGQASRNAFRTIRSNLVDNAGYHHAFSLHHPSIAEFGDPPRFHHGPAAVFPNVGAPKELGACHSGTKCSNGDTAALQFDGQSVREGIHKSFAGVIDVHGRTGLK